MWCRFPALRCDCSPVCLFKVLGLAERPPESQVHSDLGMPILSSVWPGSPSPLLVV